MGQSPQHERDEASSRKDRFKPSEDRDTDMSEATLDRNLPTRPEKPTYERYIFRGSARIRRDWVGTIIAHISIFFRMRLAVYRDGANRLVKKN